MHRARGSVFEQQVMVYDDMAAIAELSVKDPEKFIQLTKKSEVKDIIIDVRLFLGLLLAIMLEFAGKIK